MLSILIPVYNTSVIELVSRILEMIKRLDIDYEIRIADDASTDKNLKAENQKLTKHKNCFYHTFTKNKGRTATRQFLAEQAHYKHLLFFDADVMPLRENFLQIILEYLGKASVVFGGVTYPEKPSDNTKLLRYYYGKSRESKPATKRNKKPYLSLISQHLLIEKSVFLACNPAEEKAYGLDIYFSYLLQKQKVSVLHIDNPTLHLGLETNAQYLVKTHEGLQTMVNLEKAKKLPEDYRPLQRVGSALKKTGIHKQLLKLIKKRESQLIKNLCGTKPNLRLFDLYRLDYYLKLKQNAQD
ncbi:glycosyl transferase family 2 [Leeuwenhoekiella aestuarii]|uniref:Glycosyl transferase family 2 n=1 Tax=Leeuwenhoekiella aestuarii TaxID=2249426 RepID=A0A4Q0NRS7_9FLAO|nr:glycosyltransferase family A protein [Leeuwenhoekiella aestuarii]RXG13346.1 glycosyl transferase family 2 [Leeuwenhoekiella aestuarii]RXG14923.1 glycosyl transferase family 2 [Leeuwenhoekiella aestuarii]